MIVYQQRRYARIDIGRRVGNFVRRWAARFGLLAAVAFIGWAIGHGITW